MVDGQVIFAGIHLTSYSGMALWHPGVIGLTGHGQPEVATCGQCVVGGNK